MSVYVEPPVIVAPAGLIDKAVFVARAMNSLRTLEELGEKSLDP